MVSAVILSAATDLAVPQARTNAAAERTTARSFAAPRTTLGGFYAGRGQRPIFAATLVKLPKAASMIGGKRGLMTTIGLPRSLFRKWLVLSLCWLVLSLGWLLNAMFEITASSNRFSATVSQSCERLTKQTEIERCRESARTWQSVTVFDVIWGTMKTSWTQFVLITLAPIGALTVVVCLVGWIRGPSAPRQP